MLKTAPKKDTSESSKCPRATKVRMYSKSIHEQTNCDDRSLEACGALLVLANGQRGYCSNEDLNSDCYAHCLCRKVNQLLYVSITTFQCLLGVFEIRTQLKSLSYCCYANGIYCYEDACHLTKIMWLFLIGKDRVKKLYKMFSSFKIEKPTNANQGRTVRHFFATFELKSEIIQTWKGAKHKLFVCLPIEKQRCFRLPFLSIQSTLVKH